MWDFHQLFDKRGLSSMKEIKTPFLGVLFLISVILFSFTPHPYHVSYTEINLHNEKSELTLSIEVFTHDLESAIKLEFKPESFSIGNDSIGEASEKLIRNYVKSNFTVIIDGIVLKDYVFQPSKTTPKRTVTFFSLTDLPNFKSLSIYSEILINLFPDQQNIIEFNSKNGQQKSLLSNKTTSATWIIK